MIKIEHLARWITASVYEYFDSKKGSYEMFFEAVHPRKTEDHPNWFEVRLDGPHLREVSRNCWNGNVEINVLCRSSADIDLSHDDSSDQFACLVRIDGARDKIEGNYFGRIRPDTALEQGTVEGHYKLEFQL